MLTVDYELLRLQPGDRVLDLGCGFGRHAYETLRRGGHVVACDLGRDELADVVRTFDAMRDVGEIEPGAAAAAVRGDATRLPFPDAVFDRVIASEVMEHVPDDGAAFGELARVLRPGGVLAITVPAFLPERICWALSDDYHAPRVPGGHVRIYTVAELRASLSAVGLEPGAVRRAHALHTPYWWLRCVMGPNEPVERSRLVSAYDRLLTWDIMSGPAATRLADRLLNPVLGKSLVIYATRPTRVAVTRPDRHLEGTADVAA